MASRYHYKAARKAQSSPNKKKERLQRYPRNEVGQTKKKKISAPVTCTEDDEPRTPGKFLARVLSRAEKLLAARREWKQRMCATDLGGSRTPGGGGWSYGATVCRGQIRESFFFFLRQVVPGLVRRGKRRWRLVFWWTACVIWWKRTHRRRAGWTLEPSTSSHGYPGIVNHFSLVWLRCNARWEKRWAKFELNYKKINKT